MPQPTSLSELIWGRNLKAALVDTEAGEVGPTVSVPTRARAGHDAVIAQMAGLVGEVIAAGGPAEVGGVGVGVPGLLDLERGLTRFMPNFPGQWRGVPVRDALERATGLPVALLNDARAMTLGEWRFGAGRGVETVACYTLGTGIGGGLVIEGRLYLGIGGAAGELGHISVAYDGPRCGCGGRGCIEAYASGPAIAAQGMKAVAQGLTTRIAELAGNDLNRITPELIFEAAREGDEIARGDLRAGRVPHRRRRRQRGHRRQPAAGDHRRRRGAGGGAALRAAAPRGTLAPRDDGRRPGRIVPAELGTQAGLMGAAAWARQSIEPAEHEKLSRRHRGPSAMTQPPLHLPRRPLVSHLRGCPRRRACAHTGQRPGGNYLPGAASACRPV